MSKTVDQKVVEMQFDNRQFEKNVQTSMSTLDKLKEKLNFSGASKGMENLAAAAKNNNMNVLGSAVEQVSVKFSAMQIAGITAMSRLVNSAISAGTRMVKALTVDPVRTGFQEYELKMGSIQTIMASTGESLATVNKHLDALNEYSDKTIYSFSDMTNNIGKFTNAGVKLEDAVAAMKGIANEAALSGANANEASRAMYNFAQALSSGYVKLIDWKSIELANMATVGFKEQLIETALELKTVVKEGDMYRSTTTDMAGKTSELFSTTRAFNESLSSQWMTTEVLTQTLKKYSDETTEIGKKATKAATEVKSFTQMMDALKESAQSGWAQTWEIVFGDFDKGKELWTSIYNGVSKVIDKMSDVRNTFLKNNLGSKWDKISQTIIKAGYSTEDFNTKLEECLKDGGANVEKLKDEFGSLDKAIEAGKVPVKFITKALNKLLGTEKDLTKATGNVTDSLEDFSEIAKKVIHGDFGNGAYRIEKLTEAGYDYVKVQNKVNELLGFTKRLTSELTDEQKASMLKTEENVSVLAKLSDEQLKNKGYTEDQIEALRELQKVADGTGSSLDELIKSLNKPSGRILLLDSFKNIGAELAKIFQGIGDAWNDVFNKDTEPGEKMTLYKLIEDFHALTESMNISDETASNFKTTMEGVFTLFKLGGSVASMSLLSGLKILNALLTLFGTNLLGVSSKISEYIIAFGNWVELHTMFGWDTTYTNIASVLKAIYEGLVKCIDAFLSLKIVTEIIEKFKKAIGDLFDINIDGFGDFLSIFDPENIIKSINEFFDNIATWIKGADGAKNIGIYIIEGIIQGLISGITKIRKAIWSVANIIIDTFCAILGIHSPSIVFAILGGYLIAGLIEGILTGEYKLLGIVQKLANSLIDLFGKAFEDGIPYVSELIGTIGDRFLKTFKGMEKFDLGSLFIMGGTAGFGFLAFKFIKVLEKFANPLDKLGGLFGSVKSVFTELGKSIERLGKAKAWEMRSKALLNLAISLGILTASLVLLTKYADTDKLWDAVAVIVVLSGVLVALTWAITKLEQPAIQLGKYGVKIGGAKAGLLAVAGALLVMAAVVKIMGSMDPEEAEKGLKGLARISIGLVAVFAAYGLLVKGEAANNINKAGRMIFGVAVSMLLLIAAAKLIAGMSVEEMEKAAYGLSGLLLVIASLAMISTLNANAIGKTMLAISTSMLIIIGVAKILIGMSEAELQKAAICMTGIILIIATLAMIATLGTAGIGKTIAGIAAAMLMLAVVAKIINTMTWGEMGKAAIGLIGLTVIVGLLIAIVTIFNPWCTKIASTLLAMSASILILATVAVVLSMIDLGGLAKGVAAIMVLSLCMKLMIEATQFASNCKANLIVMTVAIAVMVAAVAGLSMMDPTKLGGAVASMSILMIVFGLMVMMANTAKASIGALAVMVAVIGVLAFVIYKLASLPYESVMASAASLSILMLSLSASFALISVTGGLAVAAMPLLVVMVGVVALLAVILGALTALDCAPSLESALALSAVLLAMSTVSLVLAALGATGPLAIAGALVFIGVIAMIGFMMYKLGELMTKITDAETYIDKGIEVLEKIGNGLGSAIANIITGFLGTIAESLPGIADNLSNFATKLQPFIDGVKSIDGDFVSGMESFSAGLGEISLFDIKKLKELGTEVQEYSKAISESFDISKSVKDIKKLVETINSLSELDTEGVDKFKKAIKKLKNTSVSELTSTFSAVPNEFENVGKKIVTSMISGLESKINSLSSAAKKVANNAAKAITDNCVVNFKTSGKDLGRGLVEGIEAKGNAVYWAAYRLGRKAVQGEKDGQESNSPSKATKRAGKWLGEGLIVGINTMSDKVYKAGKSLGKSAANSITNSVSRITDLINTDIDTQPTIRPVLDLSDVRAGAGSLNGIFDNPNIGIVGSIMSKRQNGGNDDVVSAINKLSRKLGDMGNTTYNINGVSANGDSDVEGAIRVLVRAAKLEGRV